MIPFRVQRPVPSRAWIRYTPRRWPGPELPWIDLSRGGIGSSSGDLTDLEALAIPELDDTVYLPPVREDLRHARDRLVAAHRDRGTPVLVQLLPGDPAPEIPCLLARDLLSPAMGLSADRDASGEAPGAVWPLLPGGPSRPEIPSGFTHVLPVGLDVPPKELRRLVELLPDPEEGWALFHGDPPPMADILSRLRELGVQPFLPRPLPDPPWPRRTNRILAAGLALAGELGHHLGASPARSEAFLRAARFVDDAGHDLEDLAREGNLDVLPWLPEEPRTLVAWLLEREGEVECWELWDRVEGPAASVL